jgi:hypothetical protein
MIVIVPVGVLAEAVVDTDVIEVVLVVDTDVVEVVLVVVVEVMGENAITLNVTQYCGD